MKRSTTLIAAGLPTIALIVSGIAPQVLAWEDVRREWRQEMGEVRSERREAAREILDADSVPEFRREIREGVREVSREKREMRREVRREIRREIRNRI